MLTSRLRMGSSKQKVETTNTTNATASKNIFVRGKGLKSLDRAARIIPYHKQHESGVYTRPPVCPSPNYTQKMRVQQS